MARPNPGDRVGALLGSDPNTKIVQVFGYGVFEGDHVPEYRGQLSLATSCHEAEVPNPRIRLDSGELVYGAECWWGPETDIRARVERMVANEFTVETVSPREALKLDVRKVGPIEVNLADSSVLVDGKPVRVSAKQRTLLRCLAQTPDRVVSHEELCTTATMVPGLKFSNLHNAIFRLRAMLGAEAAQCVRLVHGTGYRLTAEVRGV